MMAIQHTLLRRLLLPTSLLLLAAAPALAQGEQSANDLRRENDELRQRVEALEAQLAAAERRVDELETENQELQRRLAQSRPQTDPGNGNDRPADPPQPQPADPAAPAPAGLATVPPNKPWTAPEGIFQFLQQSYQQEFADAPLETEADERALLGELQRWTAKLQREHRMEVVWLVRIEGVTEDERGREVVKLVVLDPQTGLPYDANPVRVESRRLAREVAAGPDVEYWELRALVQPAPQINPRRLDKGIFNTPRFVGPMVEFGIDVNVRWARPSVMPGVGAPAAQPQQPAER